MSLLTTSRKNNLLITQHSVSYRNQILEETIKKQKVCLQQLSDLNLEAISPKDEEIPKIVKCSEMSPYDVEEKQDIPASSTKLFSGVGSLIKTDHDLRFDLNPYNKCIT